jgi:hypothetical protein
MVFMALVFKIQVTEDQVSDFQTRTVTDMPLLFVLIFTSHLVITQQLALTTTKITCSSQAVQVLPPVG